VWDVRQNRTHLIKNFKREIMGITIFINNLVKDVADNIAVGKVELYQIKIDMCMANIQQLQKHNAKDNYNLLGHDMDHFENTIKKLEERQGKAFGKIRNYKLKEEFLDYIL